MYFISLNRCYCDSCPPGCSYRHPAWHPGVLLPQGKEEVLTTPTCARQHSPGQLGGQRASGLQQHHQAHMTPQPSPLTPVLVANDRAVSYHWTNSDWWERNQCPLAAFECWRGLCLCSVLIWTHFVRVVYAEGGASSVMKCDVSWFDFLLVFNAVPC